MPIHDWTKVSPGTWHAFHVSWISEIQLAMNSGRLPASYYALAEQILGPYGPDVLALNSIDDHHRPEDEPQGGPAVATAVAPPRARIVDETDEYALKRRTIVIRHESGDRVVALIELMSPGNKTSRRAFDSFLKKALESLERGYHLLILDLFPPTPRDPQGIHGALWSELGRPPYSAPADEPLTLAAYSAGHSVRCYVEPTAVGRELIEMPLFLEPETYVNVPLEETYRNAYRGVPERWKRVIEDRE